MKWLELFKALRKGVILTNPATWKERQVAINALSVVAIAVYGAAVAFGWVPPGLEDSITEIAGYIGGAIVGLVNIWATYATSTKVGIGNHSDDGDGGVREPERQAEPKKVSAESKRNFQRFAPMHADNRFMRDD